MFFFLCTVVALCWWSIIFICDTFNKRFIHTCIRISLHLTKPLVEYNHMLHYSLWYIYIRYEYFFRLLKDKNVDFLSHRKWNGDNTGYSFVLFFHLVSQTSAVNVVVTVIIYNIYTNTPVDIYIKYIIYNLYELNTVHLSVRIKWA